MIQDRKVPLKIMIGEPGEEDMGFYPSPEIFAPPSSSEDMYSLLYKTAHHTPTWLFLSALKNTQPFYVLTFKGKSDVGSAVVASPVPKAGLFNCAMFVVGNQEKVFSVLFRVRPRKIQEQFEEKVHNVVTQVPLTLVTAAGTVVIVTAGASVLLASRLGGGINPVATAATIAGGIAQIGAGTIAYSAWRRGTERRASINRMMQGYKSICNVFGWVDESEEYFCVYGLRMTRNLAKAHLGWGCVAVSADGNNASPHFFVSGNMGKTTIPTLSAFSRLSGAKITALDLRLGSAYEICGEEIKESQRNPISDFDRFWFVDIGEEKDREMPEDSWGEAKNKSNSPHRKTP